ncbi:cystatin-S-like [Mus pahari]|uniref:cystatin-S-like n=1 Tax=Mus pahari TaxID=10093 RepID=UPI000A308686|nr:cystatin-S-like [Mus pahari]
MACLIYTQLFLLTTLTLVLNLSLYPVLGQNAGDIEESSMEEEGAQKALNGAVIQYNEKRSDLYLSRVVEVKSVHKQVSSGKTFFFDVTLGKTTCMKNQIDLTNCPLNEQTDQKELEFCSFEVFLPSWADYIILMDYSCNGY